MVEATISLLDARLLFAASRGGMLRLVRKSSGWWLEIAHQDGRHAALSVSDEEADLLTAALEEAGIRV